MRCPADLADDNIGWVRRVVRLRHVHSDEAMPSNSRRVLFGGSVVLAGLALGIGLLQWSAAEQPDLPSVGAVPPAPSVDPLGAEPVRVDAVAGQPFAQGDVVEDAADRSQVIDIGPSGTATQVPVETPGTATVRGDGPLALGFDWGTVPAGTEIRHTFTIKNSGTRALQILRTMPSVHCRMQFDRRIEPGAEGRFEVVLATGGLPLGPTRVAIRVQTANQLYDQTIVVEGQVTAGTGGAASPTQRR